MNIVYYTGELVDDELEPAGVVRDIKDAQRELNKTEANACTLLINNLWALNFGKVNNRTD